MKWSYELGVLGLILSHSYYVSSDRFVPAQGPDDGKKREWIRTRHNFYIMVPKNGVRNPTKIEVMYRIKDEILRMEKYTVCIQ